MMVAGRFNQVGAIKSVGSPAESCRCEYNNRQIHKNNFSIPLKISQIFKKAYAILHVPSDRRSGNADEQN